MTLVGGGLPFSARQTALRFWRSSFQLMRGAELTVFAFIAHCARAGGVEVWRRDDARSALDRTTDQLMAADQSPRLVGIQIEISDAARGLSARDKFLIQKLLHGRE